MQQFVKRGEKVSSRDARRLVARRPKDGNSRSIFIKDRKLRNASFRRVIRGFSSEFSCRRVHCTVQLNPPRWPRHPRRLREREEKLLCEVVETAETRLSVAGPGREISRCVIGDADGRYGAAALMKAERLFFLSSLPLLFRWPRYAIAAVL